MEKTTTKQRKRTARFEITYMSRPIKFEIEPDGTVLAWEKGRRGYHRTTLNDVFRVLLNGTALNME
jgi:hypothetical protein